LNFEKEKSLSICIGRIFSFYHNKQKAGFLYPNIKSRLKNHDFKNEFELHGASKVRDIQSAENQIELIIKLFNSEATGIFNIGSGEGVQIQEFVRDIIKPKKIRIKDLTPNEKDFMVANINKIKLLNE
jgi:GDP-D-mannose dehydratase